ncbi:MAG: glycosyltransferase [Clostridia bacterium]|nr:glycosyltransferase [Clostridia bacterium]
MRVALLNDSFPPVIDGVANVALNYARVLTAQQQSVMVAVPDYPGVVDQYEYPVLRYTSMDTTKMVGYRAGYPFSVQAISTLADFKPDIIHSHCPVASNLMGRLLREQTGVPLVFTYHTKFDVDIRSAIRGHMLQNSLINALVRNVQASDEVWTVSRGAGENLRAIGYVGDYIVMENGVDMPRGFASPEKVAEVNALCGLADDLPVFLFAGRLRWYKGIRLIIEALARAQRAEARFHMLFVGDGSDRAAIETLCEQAGIMDVCRFVGAVSDRELLRAFYTRADLFLFPSTFDTNGIVVREAAACGLGSVLVAGSCAAEGVTDGQNGLLIAEDAESLCARVLFACAHREEVRRVGLNAQEQLYLSWDEAVRRAQERYQVVIENKKSSAGKRRRDMFPLLSDLVDLMRRAREGQKPGSGYPAV